MELKDQDRLIAYVVDTVFIPLVLQEIVKFIEVYKKEHLFARDMEHLSGYKIAVPTITIDIRNATNVLISNLKTALKNETQKQG